MHKTKAKILIVDDDKHILLSGKMFLEQHFTKIITFNTPTAIQDVISNESIDVVLLDMNFKQGDTTGKDGMYFLRIIREISPSTSVILITAYGGIQNAVEAIKIGAFDFIVKPWENEKLLASVKAAHRFCIEKQTNTRLKGQREIISSDLAQPYEEIIGNEMKGVFGIIQKVAATQAEVLILGENGTGKELVARAIHKSSERASNVFITVDLGALSESIFESELFGHKKGAFTDAQADRIGRFEAADSGTLFLDEIGNLSLSLQTKLLSAIQSKKVTPIGSNTAVDVDVRIICATNKALPQLVNSGEFREDLLYRINTVEINLPPLRNRAPDIPLLAGHFLTIYTKKYQKESLQISQMAIRKMAGYRWPGNIRELMHAIERAVILCTGNIIQPIDLGLYSASGLQHDVESLNLDNLEKWAIETAIEKHKGNISHAAKELGLSRGAMYRRIEKYEI